MPDPLQSSTDVPPLWRIGPARQKPASSLAGETAAKTTGKRRQQILRLLRERGPMTLFELASNLGVGAHQISGRVTDLKRDFLVEVTGERRKNPQTGCEAEVLRLAKAASEIEELS